MKVGDAWAVSGINRPPATYSYPLRVCLVILGVYSGKHQSKVLSLASTLYHLFTCCLDTVFVAIGELISAIKIF